MKTPLVNESILGRKLVIAKSNLQKRHLIFLRLQAAFLGTVERSRHDPRVWWYGRRRWRFQRWVLGAFHRLRLQLWTKKQRRRRRVLHMCLSQNFLLPLLLAAAHHSTAGSHPRHVRTSSSHAKSTRHSYGGDFTFLQLGRPFGGEEQLLQLYDLRLSVHLSRQTASAEQTGHDQRGQVSLH